MVYWISYYIIKFFGMIFFPFRIYGRENLPRQGGFIFASNHLSYLDPLLIGLSARRRISYMAKDSLFKNRWFGAFLRQVGTFPVRRGQPDIVALREAIRRLKKGCPLVLFPQGTRGAAGDEAPQGGVGFLVVKSGVPVVPVYIQGSDQVLPAGARWFRRHPMSVTFGAPVVLAGGESYDEVAGRVMDRILALAPTGNPVRR